MSKHKSELAQRKPIDSTGELCEQEAVFQRRTRDDRFVRMVISVEQIDPYTVRVVFECGHAVRYKHKDGLMIDAREIPTWEVCCGCKADA